MKPTFFLLNFRLWDLTHVLFDSDLTGLFFFFFFKLSGEILGSHKPLPEHLWPVVSMSSRITQTRYHLSK